MNHDHEDLRPTDAPIDALLRERLGDESAPDLSQLVAERHARGEGAAIAARLSQQDQPVVRGYQRPLLTAALLLLGIAAVIGTIWTVDGPNGNGSGGNGSGGNGQHGSQHALQQPEQTNPDPILPSPEVPTEQDPQRQGSQEQDPQKQDPKTKEKPVGIVPPPARPEANLEFSLRVVDEHGGPIQNFTIEVVQVQRQQPLRLRATASLKGITRQPRDFDGDFTTVKGLPPGLFVVVIDDGIHAKSSSSPFLMLSDKPAQVTVRMNRGGALRGVVVDADGRPVKGAVVKTAAPSELQGAPSPFLQIVQQRRASLHTLAETKTDGEGRFEFQELALGNYVLRARHIEFSAAHVEDVPVTLKARGPVKITVQRGAVVHGRVTKNGAPLQDWIVQVGRVGRAGFSGKEVRARTDKDGRFRLAERLPPGPYQIRCHDESNENPFGQLLQLKESTRTFDIGKGKAEVEQNIDMK